MRDGFFTQAFMLALPKNPLHSMVVFFSEFRRWYDSFQDSAELDYHDELVEILAIYSALSKSRGLKKPNIPATKTDIASNFNSLSRYLFAVAEQYETAYLREKSASIMEAKEAEYSNILEGENGYAFTEEQFLRIQTIINELRAEISQSNLISAGHKRRLLVRLEAMQREIHQTTTEVDRFWGFIAEAGIVCRKFGEDVKPIADRVTELGKIVVSVVMASEGIKALPEITRIFLSE